MTRQERLAKIANIAVRVCFETGVPPRMLIAQWAAESRWGAKPSGRNNFFGMTYVATRHEAFDWVPTDEVLTLQGIARLDPEEKARIRSQKLRPDGKYNVDLDRRFASYQTLEAGVRDYAWLISQGAPYRTAWAAFVAAQEKLLADVCAVYATSPAYGALVQQIAGQKNVTDAITKRARQPTQ